MATLLVALTGGIASGKTTVANFFSQLGAEVIDSDQVARQVVEPGTVGAELIRSEFGEDVFKDGLLDRTKLAEIVFADQKKRSALEAILHPLIRSHSQELFEKADGIVIYQIPLLVESKGNYEFDAVITVEADENTRLDRLVNQRGMQQSEALMRLQAQTNRSSRESIADFVIESDCTLEELSSQAKTVWAELNEMRRRKLEFS